MKPVAEIIAGIRHSIGEAVSAFDAYMGYASNAPDTLYYDTPGAAAGAWLDEAFWALRLLLETKGMLRLLEAVCADHQKAEKNFLQAEMSSGGDPYSFWAGKLRVYLDAIDINFGLESPTSFVKDVSDILRATLYSITDVNCFAEPPADEDHVHRRIEAVLRCVFPDLVHKPQIPKHIKNFAADTGLPSIQTLIEYKFVDTPGKVKQVVDEILADTRAYSHKDWKSFIYVIYETTRLMSEVQWNALLIESGVGENTRAIVLTGEVPIGRRSTMFKR